MIVHPADVPDRDGAPTLPESARGLVPWLRHVAADGGYAGDKLNDALKDHGDWTIENAVTWLYVARIKLISRRLVMA